MVKIFCDKCNKDYSEEYSTLVKSEHPGLIRVQEMLANNQYFNIDLCPECSKALGEWLQGEEETKDE